MKLKENYGLAIKIVGESLSKLAKLQICLCSLRMTEKVFENNPITFSD